MDSLIATKLFFPPLRLALVSRPRLVERLQVGIQCPLTLISAPAGYGKTTLLAEWRSGPGACYPAAWYSLGTEDNDLERFLLYLSAAFDNLQHGLTENNRPLLQASDIPNLEASLILMINRLSNLNQESVLVLDDYNLIDLSAIHQGITFLIDHLPPRLHLVLLTRSDPALPLARLRARGQLTEIRAEHLRFSIEESTQFLNQIIGLNLNREQITALEKRTEGWIAGLRLAALSMQTHDDVNGFVSAFTGSNRYIMDYLIEEVLTRQPPLLQELLLKTSILERLTGSLCDAMTGNSNGRQVLEQLDHANLFVIPLDNEKRWYRYQHLFSDLLQNRLKASFPLSSIYSLHLKAADWYEEQGLLYEALDHALAGQDMSRAGRILVDNFVAIASQHNLPSFVRWMNILPENIVLSDPRLCMFKAYVFRATGQEEKVSFYLSVAENMFEQWVEAGQFTKSEHMYGAILAEIKGNQVAQAVIKRNYAQAIATAQEALNIVPADAYYIHGQILLNLRDAYREMGQIEKALATSEEAFPIVKQSGHPGSLADCQFWTGRILKVQGRLHRAAQVYQEALQYAESHGQSQLSVYCPVYFGYADLLYEWNELDKAEELIRKGIEIGEQGGRSMEIIPGLIHLSKVQAARQEYSQALETLKKSMFEEVKSGIDQYRPELTYYQARIHQMCGDSAEAIEWISAENSEVGENLGYDQARQVIARSHLMILTGKMDEAFSSCERVVEIADKQGSIGWKIEALILQALALQKMNDMERMQIKLQDALTLAQSEGYIRIFLDEGAKMIELLQTIQKREISSRYITRLISEFTKESYEGKDQNPQVSRVKLSKREIELLRLIAEGCTNKEIAVKLFISLATVKRHTVNIFNKLDVKNRTEAVACARGLGIL